MVRRPGNPYFLIINCHEGLEPIYTTGTLSVVGETYTVYKKMKYESMYADRRHTDQLAADQPNFFNVERSPNIC
jgi:hypothetical protein